MIHNGPAPPRRADPDVAPPIDSALIERTLEVIVRIDLFTFGLWRARASKRVLGISVVFRLSGEAITVEERTRKGTIKLVKCVKWSANSCLLVEIK